MDQKGDISRGLTRKLDLDASSGLVLDFLLVVTGKATSNLANARHL